MEEQEKPKTETLPKNKEITLRIHIHQSYFEIKLPEGSTLIDLLRKLQAMGKISTNLLKEFLTISINGKNIRIEQGVLKENPLLGDLFSINFMRKIKGGCSL